MLKEKHPSISLVGFADDTNLLAFGKKPEVNVQQLEQAWKTCVRWAKTRGMVFAAQKCELVHFNKGRRQWPNPLKLAHPEEDAHSVVEPVGSCRFLGVWLDRKLSWKDHRVAVERKLKTQDFALSRRYSSKNLGPWPDQSQRSVHKVHSERDCLRCLQLSYTHRSWRQTKGYSDQSLKGTESQPSNCRRGLQGHTRSMP